MASKSYIELLSEAIEDVHGCNSRHVESVPVHEMFRDQTVWKGHVEVFELMEHPKAKRVYAWSQPTAERNKDDRIITVLEIPPIDSAKKAVQTQILKDVTWSRSAPVPGAGTSESAKRPKKHGTPNQS